MSSSKGKMLHDALVAADLRDDEEWDANPNEHEMFERAAVNYERRQLAQPNVETTTNGQRPRKRPRSTRT